jgi:hypothetical protein
VKWLADPGPCVFGGPHDAAPAFYLIKRAAGPTQAGCHHNSCAGMGWRNLREIFEPGCYARKDDQNAANGANGPGLGPEGPAIDADSTAVTTVAYSDDHLQLAATHGADLKFVAGWDKWWQWNGSRWAEDNTLAIFDIARRECRKASADLISNAPDPAKVQKSAHDITSKQTVAAITSLARSDRRIAATVSQWDKDAFVLNTPIGAIDLKTSKLRAPCRADYLTKTTAIAPADRADCPIWIKALREIFNGDTDQLAFIQRGWVTPSRPMWTRRSCFL